MERGCWLGEWSNGVSGASASAKVNPIEYILSNI
jgi:hypothetical protein